MLQVVWKHHNKSCVHFISRQYGVFDDIKNRDGFGSFHSEDIESLVSKATPPSHGRIMTKDTVESINFTSSSQNVKIGKFFKESLFCLDDDWTFINHGAFGACLKPLMAESTKWRYLCEQQPLAFFDRILLPMVAQSVRAVAELINCSPRNLLPLPNVTSGLNSIINSVVLHPGDEIICLSLTYGSTKKMLKDKCARTGASLIIVDLALPIASPGFVKNEIISALSMKTKLVILDHITSNTGMVLPVLDIAAACKAAGAIVVIDAAHALFSQHIQIERRTKDSNPDDQFLPCISDVADVWLSNGHKWLCAPKGCAFMWISPRMVGRIRPAIISHGFSPGKVAATIASKRTPTSGACKGMEVREEEDDIFAAAGKHLSAFAWDGCRDYAALLTVPSAIHLWKMLFNRLPVNVQGEIQQQHPSDFECDGDGGGGGGTSHSDGLDVWRSYNRALLRDATDLISTEWKIDASDFAAPREMREASPMSLIPLPRRVQGLDTTKDTTDAHAFSLQEYLHHEHKVEVPIKCLEGRLYTRISAHIYNDIDDYAKFAADIKKLV